MKHPQCSICTAPRRHDLESEIADGGRLRPLARKFGVSYDSLWRHWRRHLTPEQKDRLRFGDAPAHKLKGICAEDSITVLRDLNFARNSIIEALAAAPAQDAQARASLTGRLHENARIRGTLNGQLARSPLIEQNNTVVFVNDPQFALFQADLIRALSRFPEAREAVLVEFEKLETVPTGLPALEHQEAAHAVAG